MLKPHVPGVSSPTSVQEKLRVIVRHDFNRDTVRGQTTVISKQSVLLFLKDISQKVPGKPA